MLKYPIVISDNIIPLIYDRAFKSFANLYSKELVDFIINLCKLNMECNNYNLINKYTNKIINLESNQHNYDFGHQNNYHKYFFKSMNDNMIRIKFYVKRQHIYQKKKILMKHLG